MLSVVPTVVFWADTFGAGGGYSFVWFVCLYLTAAYIRRFGREGGRWFRGYLACTAVITALAVAIWYIPSGAGYAFKMYSYNFLPVYISAVCLFRCFLGLRMKDGLPARQINRIASLTFGIFLMHSHFILRDRLWVALGTVKYANAGLLPLHLVGSVLAVFALCGVAEYVRKIIFAKFGAILRMKEKWKVLEQNIDQKIDRFTP